eukprot:3189584-Prymnesium_polylepis.1
MSGAHAACAEHRATHSSASGGSARKQLLALCSRRCPFSVHAGHATRRPPGSAGVRRGPPGSAGVRR